MDVVLAWGNFGLSKSKRVDKVRLAGNCEERRRVLRKELDQGRGADAVHDPGPVGCEGRGKGGGASGVALNTVGAWRVASMGAKLPTLEARLTLHASSAADGPTKCGSCLCCHPGSALASRLPPCPFALFLCAGISSRTISGFQPAVRVGATRAHDRSTSVPLGRYTLFRCTNSLTVIATRM